MTTKRHAYDALISSYNTNDSIFASSAMTLADKTEENPFEKGTLEYGYLNDMKRHYNIWKKGGVGNKISLRRMIDAAKQLAGIAAHNPFTEEDEKKEIEQEQQSKKQEKIEQLTTSEKQYFEKNEDIEIIEDIRYVMLAMVKAYNTGNEINFKQFAVHLADIAVENPFKEGTEEFNVFAEMVACYRRKPSNIRRVHVLAGKLCEIINGTEIYPEKIEPKKVINKEPQKVLGVLPEEEKDKKSWNKFLHPWKKEGENDDN